MIATARANAHRHVERLLADQLAPKRRGELDALLDGTDGPTSGIADLRRRAVRIGVKELLGQLQQYRRGSYSHLRPAMHAVLDTVELCGATSADDELPATLERVRAARGRFVDELVGLLPKTWRAWVLDDGRVQRTRYALGMWSVARDALRAERMYRPIGRRYANPAGFLMPADRWHAERDELAVTFDRTQDPEQRLGQLEADQQHALRRRQTAVDAGGSVRHVAGRLEFSPPGALDESPAAVRLRAELERLTPRIDIPDLLAEVEQWTGFTGQLTHAAGATPRMADLPQQRAQVSLRADQRSIANRATAAPGERRGRRSTSGRPTWLTPPVHDGVASLEFREAGLHEAGTRSVYRSPSCVKTPS